jgi:hypothetical protein
VRRGSGDAIYAARSRAARMIRMPERSDGNLSRARAICMSRHTLKNAFASVIGQRYRVKRLPAPHRS